MQQALERIARARALGKPNVKLTRAEIDALERLERNQNPPRPSAAPKTAPKSKKEAPVKRKPVQVEVRKKSGRNDPKSASNSPKGKAVESRSRGRSSASSSGRESRDDSVVSYALPPADPDYGRRLPYPRGYYVTGPRQAESSRQGSRPTSNQSMRQEPVQQMAAYQHPYYTHRYSSNPDIMYGMRPGSSPSHDPRPDPSDPDWEPRARSTSSLVNVPLDQLSYQTSITRAPRFDPSDPRFASPQRRVTSGPPAIPQSRASRYSRPQDQLFLPPVEQSEVYQYLAPTDSEGEGDNDEDSDYDEGVQVDVSERPGGNYAIQTRSAAAASSSANTTRARAGGNGKSTAGRAKKGR